MNSISCQIHYLILLFIAQRLHKSTKSFIFSLHSLHLPIPSVQPHPPAQTVAQHDGFESHLSGLLVRPKHRWDRGFRCRLCEFRCARVPHLAAVRIPLCARRLLECVRLHHRLLFQKLQLARQKIYNTSLYFLAHELQLSQSIHSTRMILPQYLLLSFYNFHV